MQITNPEHLKMLDGIPYGDSVKLGGTEDGYTVWLDHEGYWLDSPWDAGYVSYEPKIV